MGPKTVFNYLFVCSLDFDSDLELMMGQHDMFLTDISSLIFVFIAVCFIR